jgi:glycerol-3-phosphate dehydrogenase subunit B
VKGNPLQVDLMVMGTGIAGMAAALFAVDRGLTVAQAGMSAEINFASGLVDLLSVYPMDPPNLWDDPWKGVTALVKAEPGHPYARMEREEIQTGLLRFFRFMAEAGQPYSFTENRNVDTLTAAGTVKRTYGVPATMAKGAAALKEKADCLLVDIQGLKGFSAVQIARCQHPRWPGLRTARIDFPRTRGEVYIERLARSLEVSENRRALAQRIEPHLQEAAYVGLPAILGIHRSLGVLEDVESMLGAKVFEIPAMPPSVTGIRIREAFEQELPRRGVIPFYQKRVTAAGVGKKGEFTFRVGDGSDSDTPVLAKGAILATGRFLGHGLKSDRNRIRETVFDLPVIQPEGRSQWHRRDFFHLQGHEINRAGIETDACFRPLGTAGAPFHENLFAVGAILAHSDWTRLKCGAGVAIATAHAAVKQFASSG